MNKVELGLAVALVGVVLYIGCLVYYEQTNQLDSWMDEHPGEIPEIGGPPNLLLMAGIILPMAIAMFIIIKWMDYVDKKYP